MCYLIHTEYTACPKWTALQQENAELRAALQESLQALRDTVNNSYPAWRVEELNRIGDLRIKLSGILSKE